MKWSHVAVLAPSFYISRLLGITPLLAIKNQDSTLEFAAHRILLAISLFSIIGMVYMSVFITIDYMPKIINHRFRYVPYSACIMLSCYGSIVILGSASFYHGHIVRAFNEVHELSRQLMGNLGHNRLPSEAFFAPTTVVLMTIRYILQVFNFRNDSVQLTAYQYSYLISLSSQSLLTGFLFYLESFFKCLNTELSEIKLVLNLTPTEVETWLIVRRLRHLRKVHNRIHDLCDIVCERFSLDIFVIFGIIIFVLLSTLYAGIWIGNIISMSLINALNVCHWGFLILRLVHMCYRSDCVIKQSEATSAKVQSLMTAYLPTEIKQEIYHFTLQTMLRKVEITAYGFYGLRMETITTLGYLITTTLVMAINLFGVI